VWPSKYPSPQQLSRLRAIPHFELEPGCTLGFTFTQGGAIVPRSLPLRWGLGSLFGNLGLPAGNLSALADV
jgi:hypothetical protein